MGNLTSRSELTFLILHQILEYLSLCLVSNKVLCITYSMFITRTITLVSVPHRQLHIEIPLLPQNLNLTHILVHYFANSLVSNGQTALNFSILLFLTCIFIKPLSKHSN
ncbi:hypothetical protein EUGRSUZ_C01827 [Eucalyptus grandis]|uniref:Uncharacterized protein n=2 Tax=Eucalyptus grandis TaxID=71139 RepID=A0ACC3LDB7_EUCGR|nr:hypothetical protein EUGRSUZ_C01827 [Eucalyptus grandis]